MRFWTKERSGQLKNNKMKAGNFNPNQLPSWPATFCVCNIILAISSTILVSQREFLVYNLLEFFFVKWQHQCYGLWGLTRFFSLFDISIFQVTHALVLDKANKNCFENLVEVEDCTGTIHNLRRILWTYSWKMFFQVEF